MKIPPYKIDGFINGIKNEEKLCGVLLYGPESGLVSIRSKKISEAIVDNISDPFLVSNIKERQLEEDKSLVSDEFSSISMMGGRKLIRIENVGNKITDSLKLCFGSGTIKDEFRRPAGENFILITAGELDASSSLRKFAELNPNFASLACYEDNQADSAGAIRQKLKEYGFQVENGVVEMIVNKFGKNRLIILNEIEKLALFMGNDKNLTIQKTQQSIADISQISINEFVNNFVNLDIEKAIYFLGKLFGNKINAIAIIRFLANYFLKLKTVKNNVSNGANLESEIKSQRIFFKEEALFKSHLNKWSLGAIDSVLLKLQELEARCKSTNSNPELLLGAFVNFIYIKYKKVR